jgi:hypothetical protein
MHNMQKGSIEMYNSCNNVNVCMYVCVKQNNKCLFHLNEKRETRVSQKM